MHAMVVSQHGPPDVFRWEPQELPPPGPHQVRLKMLATSVNFADVKARRAPYRRFRAPFVPGFDGVGIVEATGEEVQDLRPGMRVAAYTDTGSYATHALAREQLCFPWEAPKKMEDGVGIGILITSYNALTLAGRMQRGERVLVHAGAGGVGSMCIQIARALGADKVFATVGHPDKQPFCQKLGADVTLYRQQDTWEQVLQTHFDDQPLDLILNTLGGPYVASELKVLAPFGRIVMFGHSTSTPGQVETPPLHRNNQAIIGYSSGGYRKHRPAIFQERGHEAIRFFEQHQLHVPIAARFPLQQVRQAHELIEQRKHTGKIILTIEDSPTPTRPM